MFSFLLPFPCPERKKLVYSPALLFQNVKQVTKQTIALYWHYAKQEKLLGLFGYLGFAAAFGVGLVTPIFYKNFFDTLERGIGNPAAIAEDLVRIILIILALHGLQQAFFRIGGYAFNRFQPKTLERLANSVFISLHGHSFIFFISRFVGSIVRKANRLVDSFERMQDTLIFDFLPLAIRIVVVTGVLFFWYPTIGLIMLGWIVFFLALNTAYAVYKVRFDADVAAIDSRTTACLADTITNNQNVKLFAAERMEADGYALYTAQQRKKRIFVHDLNNWADLIQGILMALLEFAVFYIAIQQWVAGNFTIGDFALIQAYIIQVFVNIWQFGRMIQRMYQHLANAEEMTEILNTPHEVQDKPSAKELTVQRGEVAFQNVSFAYHKTREVVRDFSLTVHSGEKIGLVGPSGAGKTTLVGLLFRFFDVTSGRITIDGQNIADVTQESLRRMLAFVPQDPVLFHRTLKDNIRYGRPDASEADVLAAANAAHCDEFIAQLPDGYDTYVGERGVKLSGGERQRVAIARAILKDAPILVLDEATSSLDSHVEAMIQDALAKLMEGKTTIVIAHRLSTINKMDRIIVVDAGQIKEEGTHDVLLQHEGGLYKKLWELQAGGFIQ